MGKHNHKASNVILSEVEGPAVALSEVSSNWHDARETAKPKASF
jgi:hypothetical protein